MNNIFEVSNISKKYKAFSIDDLSFEIPEGYITGFIGPNGSGKTTTIKMLLSLIKADSGEIFYGGKNIKNYPYIQNIGMITDESFLSKDWTIAMTEKAMAVAYDRWDGERFFGYTDHFNIDRKLHVRDLSRGMKIKLMLSIALSHNAETLILDEPTSGLDPGMRDELADILKDFVNDENHTVLFSTHITQDLESIADYIIFIMNGKLVTSDTKDEFMDKYRLLKGAAEDLDKLDSEYIIGSKSSSVGFEALILNDNLKNISGNFEIEIPSIDKIMIYHGRR